MERESPTEEVLPKLFWFSAETAPQLVNRGARNDVENIIWLVVGANYDADEFHRLMK